MESKPTSAQFTRRALLAGIPVALGAVACSGRSTQAARCLLAEPLDSGPLVINRLVYVLVDRSRSVLRHRAEIDAAVKERIVGRAGPGDWLYGFGLETSSAAYNEENIVFAPAPDAPMVRRNLATGAVTPKSLASGCSEARAVQAELDASWARFEIEKRRLVQAIDDDRPESIRRSGGHRSAYLASLGYLGARLARAPKTLARWLFVIGDLQENPAGSPAEAARKLRQSQGRVFADTRVRLVRPAGNRDEMIEQAWGAYFRELGARDVGFYYLGEQHTAALDPTSVPPPSLVLAGAESR